MKDFIVLFILCTVLEIAFTAFYFLLTKTVGSILVIGVVLYVAIMAAILSSYRQAVQEKQKTELLDSLPG